MAVGMEYRPQSDMMLQQILLSERQVMGSPAQTRSVGGIRPLNATEIVQAVEKELVDALGAYGSTIHDQRRVNLRRYYGKPFGNEVEGQSKAQVMAVADTIEWMMPAHIRAIFGAGRNIWDFQATRPDQELYAEQASDSVNHVFLSQLEGFEVIHDLVKTAILEKRSFACVHWDERTEPRKNTYRGVSEEMVGMITSDPNVEVTELGPHRGEVQIDPLSGMPVDVYDMTIVRRTSEGRIRIDSIAPEHMLLARREVKLDDETRFSGYRKNMTVGDLIGLGYDPDIVSVLPHDSREEFNEGRIERLYDENAWSQTHPRGDGASREVWVNYIYIRLDEDGDGYAELREIVCVGDTNIIILSDREVNRNPLVSLCPILMPHKFHGMCPADQAVDDQMASSQILRQLLDNQVRVNNSRFVVVDGEVEIDDLVANLPGGAVRADSIDSIKPLLTAPLPQTNFQLLDYMSQRGERRTGVSSWQQGPDAADMKYQTAGAVSNVATASESRVNLINTVFAQTGLKRLGKLIYQTMCENYAGPFVFRLRGRWMECDPRQWDQEMDCVVEVGQGIGQMEARNAQLMQVGQLQQAMLQNGLNQFVSPRQLFNTAKAMVKNFDLGHSNLFFTDPGDEQWPQPQPSTEDQVKLMETQRRTQEGQAKSQNETMKLAVQASGQDGMALFRREELAADTQIDLLQMENERFIAKMNIEAQLRASVGSHKGNTHHAY